MKYVALFLVIFCAILYGASLWRRLPAAHRSKIAARLLRLLIPMLIAGLCVLATILLSTNGATVRLI